jgi:hypothetical protein
MNAAIPLFSAGIMLYFASKLEVERRRMGGVGGSFCPSESVGLSL